MSDDNNIQNGQPNGEQEPTNKKERKYREICEEELEHILENHEKWLRSIKIEGFMGELLGVSLQNFNPLGRNLENILIKDSDLRMADFTDCNLKNASILNTNLQESSFWNCNLEGANLQLSDLSNATLWRANVSGANLEDVNLQNAKLNDIKGLEDAKIKHANLINATGLMGNEFSQTDLTGVKLPDDIKEFQTLEIVKETSQNARKIFFGMLLGCVYSWLTIGSTTDVNLLTNTASSPLPIIQTEIPIARFYIVAPLVLLCIYFYFHLYLIKLWEALSGLPAIFPDGKRLDERAYPWILNGLVRKHFRILKEDRPIEAHLQEHITIFLAWWVVPITMMGFWVRYIPRHDWQGTIFHIIMIFFSVWFAITSFSLCALHLHGNNVTSKIFPNNVIKTPIICILSIYLVLCLLSLGAIEGSRDGNNNINTIHKRIAPLIFKNLLFGYDVFADLSLKSISEKPDRYWEIPEEELTKYLKGANLKYMNLNNANMIGSYLVKSDLTGAKLRNARLGGANLQEVSLDFSDLQDADLGATDLQKASLLLANLQNAYMYEANLHKADLSSANLQKAKLFETNLHKADLSGAKLQKASFYKANLKEADLSNAKFKGSDLSNTILNNADLRNADLRGVKSLKIGQLCKAKSLYKAELDHELIKLVSKCCPHLLERPKDEEDKTKIKLNRPLGLLNPKLSLHAFLFNKTNFPNVD